MDEEVRETVSDKKEIGDKDQTEKTEENLSVELNASKPAGDKDKCDTQEKLDQTTTLSLPLDPSDKVLDNTFVEDSEDQSVEKPVIDDSDDADCLNAGKQATDKDKCDTQETLDQTTAISLSLDPSDKALDNTFEDGEEQSAEKPVVDESDDADSLSRYKDVAEQLAQGCLKEHLPHIEHSKEQLTQLTESQRVLIETIHQENQKFGECQTLTDVTDVMDKAKLYLEKLTRIKKEMFALHDKSAKLKRRALKIQQEKMKEELQREHQKERELERERQLIAQPVRKSEARASPSTHVETSGVVASKNRTDVSSKGQPDTTGPTASASSSVESAASNAT